MSKNTTTKVYDSDDKLDLAIGIVTILTVLALVAWFFISMSVRAQGLTPIASAQELRRGTEQQLTCQVKSDKIKDGAKVIWSVNGKKAEESVYNANEPLTFNYTPETTGQNTVSVKVGKYKQTAMVNVLPPVLTMQAPNITITYGDELPSLNYDCNGFVDGDNCGNLCYDGSCAIADYANCGANCGKLNAGVYRIQFDKPCCFKDYEVNMLEGTLTVLPKELKVTNTFYKTYDQTNVIEAPDIVLDGAVEGDEVNAVCDKLYFDNKNAGSNKSVMLANVQLVGEDSCNYCLTGEAHGIIAPKRIAIDGLTIKDKVYDGTTKATIDKMGSLSGILDGDSVAIGSIDVNFADAYVGTKEIVINDVTLIGLDKDNYVVDDVKIDGANITTTMWNKIFDRDPIVAG